MRTLTIGLLLTLSTSALAADWPQWRGPERDCRVSRQQWPESLEGGHLAKVWSLPMGPSYSGPIVVEDRVFVTETRDESHEVIRALDRSSGGEIWKTEWKGAMKVAFFARENGSWIRSTPACDGKDIFVAGIRDVLVSLDAETGVENWRIDLVSTLNGALPGFGTVCSPLLEGDSVILQAAASVIRVRKSDGSILWRSKPESGGLFGQGMGASAFSSPVIATLAGRRQLVVQSRKSLFGLDIETGERLWSTDVEAFRGMNILTPTIIGDSVFTSTYGGGTFLYDVRNTDGQFQVTERWNTKKQGYMSSPVLIDDRVYLHLRNQRFTCIDPQDGSTKWTTRPFGKYWSTVANGDRLLTLDQDGMLHLIAANDEKYESLSSRRVSDQETWAHLAIADDQLFVRELNAMTMWTWQ